MVSGSHAGFCVVEPMELKAFKNIFVSLRLPYSVRRYEQMTVVAVIYNYGPVAVQVKSWGTAGPLNISVAPYTI